LPRLESLKEIVDYAAYIDVFGRKEHARSFVRTFNFNFVAP